MDTLTLTEVVANPQTVMAGIGLLIFNLCLAVILVIAGWIVGMFLKQVVAKVLQALKLDEWAARHKLKDAVGGVPLSQLVGSFVKWYVVLLFLQSAVHLIALEPLANFVGLVLVWLPFFIAGALIVVLGLMLAKFVKDKILATNLAHKKTVGLAMELIIIYVALVMGLSNAGINVTILERAFEIAFTAFVFVFAIVLGVSFGLAFKKDAKQFVMDIKRDYGPK